MKKTILIAFVFLFLSFLFGCKDETRERGIVYRAGLQFEARPDSVLQILDSISLPEEMSLPLATEWSMLYARSADKIGKTMPYVSQMQVAVNYYKDKKRWAELSEAYLYLGRSYVEDRAFDKALQAYNNGLTAALQCKDYNRAGYICSYWGSLYEIDNNYSQAIEKFELSNQYFQQAGNLKSYVFGLVNEARCYVIKEENQSALNLLLKADSVATSLNDPEVVSYVCNGLGSTYCELKEYDLAESYMLKGIGLDSTYTQAYYTNLANIYYGKGDYEEALFYLKKSEPLMKNNISLAGLDYDYYKLNKEKGDLKQALSHLENFVEVLDSVNTVENTINLVEIENKYNHVLLKNENSQLQRANQNKYILLLLILSVCLFLIVIYLLTLKRKNQYINKQQQIIIKQNQEIYAIAIELQQKKEELQQQAIRLEESKRLLHLQDTLEEERTKYELLKDTVDSLNDRLVTLKEERLCQSTVAKKLVKMSQTIKSSDKTTLITDRYWHTIEEQVVEVYPDLLNTFLSKGLTLAEQHLCYLTLFKLDTKAIAILLQINPDSVNKQRLRARQKLDLVGKSTDLYEYLISI